jgi:hypothetical protein
MMLVSDKLGSERKWVKNGLCLENIMSDYFK